MNKIVVVGSSNTDLIAQVDNFPLVGETIRGNTFLQVMGGKGANQALAAHKLGGDVKFITCLGDDVNSRTAIDYYKNEGLDVSSSLVVKDIPMGTALIMVNNEGENCIVIIPGANNQLSKEYIEKTRLDIATADIVVLQMEIPYPTVKAVCEIAHQYQTKILLNVAPAHEIDIDVLRMVDYLVVNETEIETISKKKIDLIGAEATMDSLLLMGAKTIILTLGKNGSYIRNESVFEFIPAYKVEAIDSTAAGDTYCGALAARMSKGSDLMEAIHYATAAAAICVTRMGAQPSIPTEKEVLNFIGENKERVESDVMKQNGLGK